MKRILWALRATVLATLGFWIGQDSRAQDGPPPGPSQAGSRYLEPRWMSGAYPGGQGSPQMGQPPTSPGVGRPPAALPATPEAGGMGGAMPGGTIPAPSGVTDPSGSAAAPVAVPSPPGPDFGAASSTFSPAAGGFLSGAGGAFNMIGDMAPISFRQQQLPIPTTPLPGSPNPAPPLPRPGQASALVPTVRALKIAENQSPRPQDRVYVTFNYFDNLNASLNRAFQAPVQNLQAYRYIFGLEKTFMDGRGSFGVRLPLNTISAEPTPGNRLINVGAGTYTALNDLSLIAKYVQWQDASTGSLVSAGLVVTPPTGPRTFANAPFLDAPGLAHSTQIQPFIGYLWNRGDFFLHGFTAIDFPLSPAQATNMYNDIGLGYYLHRAPEDRFLTAIVPTLELHVNTPLNHRNEYDINDPAGTPDVVDLTFGTHFGFSNRSVLTMGVVTPLTGPKPFDFEAVLLLNIYFGRSRAPRSPTPFVGG